MTLSHYAITYAPSLGSPASDYVEVAAIAESISEAARIADRSAPDGFVLIGVAGQSGRDLGPHASACRAYRAASA